MTSPTLTIRPHASMDAPTLAVIAGLDQALFADHQFANQFVWAEPDWHLLIERDGQLLSYLELVERQALVGGVPAMIMGIGTVMTQPSARGQGLATRALQTAQHFLLYERAAAYGLLFCTAQIVPFYQQLGWQMIHAPVRVMQPSGPLMWPESAMILPRHPEHWRDQPIHLCGLPW